MLPFRSGRPGSWGFVSLVRCLILLCVDLLISAGSSRSRKPKSEETKQTCPLPHRALLPGEQSLTNIPLPIGHEAKGLVLPDFDFEGHLRGRFEADGADASMKYTSAFTSLKIMTYTPESQPDLTDRVERVSA